jgi:hypothetical protein
MKTSTRRSAFAASKLVIFASWYGCRCFSSPVILKLLIQLEKVPPSMLANALTLMTVIIKLRQEIPDPEIRASFVRALQDQMNIFFRDYSAYIMSLGYSPISRLPDHLPELTHINVTLNEHEALLRKLLAGFAELKEMVAGKACYLWV